MTKYKKYCLIALLIISTGGFIIQNTEIKKVGSTKGRTLIWKVTSKMIMEKPILGHGLGAFEEKYMHYQADYFERRPDSDLARVAGTVVSPFNEGLRIWCETGLIGLLLVCILLYLAIFKIRGKNAVYYLILTLFVTSTFSYPFRFLTFQTLLGVLLACSTRYSYIPETKILKGHYLTAVCMLISGFTILVGPVGILAPHDPIERKRMIHHELAVEPSRESMEKMDSIVNTLPGPGLFVIMGQRWLELGDEQKAGYYFRRAVAMAPSRFNSLYGLFTYYESIDNRDSALLTAERLLKIWP